MRYLIVFMVLSLCKVDLVAQAEAKVTPTIQPSIMVIPYAGEKERLITVLDQNVNKRIAITKVKEGFDDRGFTTIDFKAKLKQMQNEKAMEMDNQSSIKQRVIELSGADIYVEADVKINKGQQGNAATVILTAYDAFSGQSLANKVSSSPKFYTENYEKLVQKAVDNVIEAFLNTMQSKFDDIIKNGRTLVVNVGFHEDSEYDMDYETEEGDLLSDLIEDWLEKNAYNGYYHVQGITATKMILDDVRIPLRDVRGRNYRPSKFAAAFRKFLRENGMDASRDIQGTKLFITIN